MTTADQTKSGRAFQGALVVAAIYAAAMAVYAWHEWPHFLAMGPVDLGEFLAGALAPLGIFGLLLTIHQAQAALARAGDANAIARTVGQAQVRCYLSSRTAEFKMEQTGSPTLEMTVSNSGQSPARDFRFSYRVRLTNVTDAWAWECECGLAAVGSGRIIPAGQDGKFSLTLANGQQMPQGQVSDFLLGPKTIFKVEVTSEWQDVFDQTFSETWRFQAHLAINLLDAAVPLFPDTPAVIRDDAVHGS